MRLNKYILSAAFISAVTSLLLLNNNWAAMMTQEHLLFSCLTGLVIHFILQFFPYSKISRPELTLNLVFFVFLFMIFVFPVRNLDMGDGIGMLLNLTRESLIFGYQLTIDELLEAWLHSKLFLLIDKHDPILPYRLLSTTAGIVFIVLFVRFMIKNKFSKNTALLLPGSGGILLFAGYAENYTLATLMIFITVTTAYNVIRENRTDSAILPVALSAAISALFHLVSGYLLPALVYLTWISTKRNSFVKNAILAAATALPVLLLPITYVMFFSDPLMDRTQAIVMNPPLYPLKRIISMNHFYEIISVIVFTSLPAFFTLLYLYIFRRDALKSLVTRKENRFLLLVVSGFFIHAMVHNPQLGFPADWDLMSFYWLPMTLLATAALSGFNEELKYLLPVFLFAFLFNMFNLQFLSAIQPEKKLELEHKVALAHSYAESHKKDYDRISPKDKKFYLWADFFLFRTGKELSNIDNDKARRLLDKNRQFKKQLNNAFTGNKQNDEWLPGFIRNVTTYHYDFLKLTGQIRE